MLVIILILLKIYFTFVYSIHFINFYLLHILTICFSDILFRRWVTFWRPLASEAGKCYILVWYCIYMHIYPPVIGCIIIRVLHIYMYTLFYSYSLPSISLSLFLSFSLSIFLSYSLPHFFTNLHNLQPPFLQNQIQHNSLSSFYPCN